MKIFALIAVISLTSGCVSMEPSTEQVRTMLDNNYQHSQAYANRQKDLEQHCSIGQYDHKEHCYTFAQVEAQDQLDAQKAELIVQQAIRSY